MVQLIVISFLSLWMLYHFLQTFDLAMESISNRWTHISSECNIPKDEFIIALQLIFDSTFFTFNNKLYRQKLGIPMSSPLSPIADLVLQDLEKRALENRYTFILDMT